VIRYDIWFPSSFIPIEPNGADSCRFASLDVAGQAVSDHHGVFWIRDAGLGEDRFEKAFVRLLEAQFLTDEDAVEKGRYPACGVTSMLDGCDAVGGQIEQISPLPQFR